MNIRFLNHSSFIIHANGKKILCDFWNEDKIYFQSWSLLSDFKIEYEEFSNIDYIWFSHGHPDHFHTPSIKKIPLKFRRNIIVLTQNSEDKNLVEFCKDLNFKQVVELNDWDEFSIAKSFNIYCKSHRAGDSFCFFKINSKTILNLNDCNFKSKNEIVNLKKRVGEVDYLFTKYSFGSWPGNPQDVEVINNTKQIKLLHLFNLCKILKPKYLLPFASNVFFTKEENKYMNIHSIKLDEIEVYINYYFSNIKVIVLYPSDTISKRNQDKWNNKMPISKYAEDYKSKMNSKLTFEPKVDLKLVLKKY